MTAISRRPVPTSLHGRVDVVDGRPVQVMTTSPDDEPVPDVVVVPGLGLPGYLLPTLHSLADRGLTSTVLDLPGFGGRGPRACAPSITAVGEVAAAWLLERCAGSDERRVVLVGHSTGAQAALRAAVELPDDGPVSGLVAAGPTMVPGQRTLPRLVAAAPRAYRRDSVTQLFALRNGVRSAPDVVRMIVSGTRDTPEQTIARLRLPVVLTAGRHDGFAPAPWLAALARAAVLSPSARVVQLPGSHNNLYTHPVPFCGLVAALVRSTARGPATG